MLADVDGTLVTEDKVLTERARKPPSTRCATPASASPSPAAGRRVAWPCCSIALDIDTPIAGFNGGLFVKRDLIDHRTEDAAGRRRARRRIELMREHGLDAWVYRGNDWLITKADAPHVAREAWTVKFEPKVVADFASI